MNSIHKVNSQQILKAGSFGATQNKYGTWRIKMKREHIKIYKITKNKLGKTHEKD